MALDMNALGHLPVIWQIGLVAGTTYIQEDLAALAAGTAVIERQLALAPAALGIFCGVLSANLTFWLVGRVLGPAAFRLPGLRAAGKGGILEKARIQFDRSGFWAIFISRFLPGTRIPVCTLAGILGMSFPRYFLYSVIAILPWTALLLWIPDRIMALAKWGAIWWLLPGVVVLGGLWWWRRRLVSKEAS